MMGHIFAVMIPVLVQRIPIVIQDITVTYPHVMTKLVIVTNALMPTIAHPNQFVVVMTKLIQMQWKQPVRELLSEIMVIVQNVLLVVKQVKHVVQDVSTHSPVSKYHMEEHVLFQSALDMDIKSLTC
jgi:hypothetical protein